MAIKMIWFINKVYFKKQKRIPSYVTLHEQVYGFILFLSFLTYAIIHQAKLKSMISNFIDIWCPYKPKMVWLSELKLSLSVVCFVCQSVSQ